MNMSLHLNISKRCTHNRVMDWSLGYDNLIMIMLVEAIGIAIGDPNVT